jgi:hypothetical protein
MHTHDTGEGWFDGVAYELSSAQAQLALELTQRPVWQHWCATLSETYGDNKCGLIAGELAQAFAAPGRASFVRWFKPDMRRGEYDLRPAPYAREYPPLVWYWHKVPIVAPNRGAPDSDQLVFDPMMQRPLPWDAYVRSAFIGQVVRIVENQSYQRNLPLPQ